MPDTVFDPLAGFTPARRYTMESVVEAPRTPGTHVVLEGDVVVYVGRTRNLRQRLRQHLSGSRASSVLHEQVGQLLDRPGSGASTADIASWLGRCEVRWQEIDNPESVKEVLVLALRPRFNRIVPKVGTASLG
ncbi:GIY-YIG nuclease family protein [Micromonospora sp. LH3U1]|uniref:GIY-YIG nuclease family protein n=1 Tax=Micromonospora sp. LH3U1 TaxID=3018339 RepID=UPI00234AD2F7|nr:GIY-YIG nuclease family protein [Micromonospora sp. LH3U1]WCN82527.1 GIY-YIG nuclease family protein [Micromonospora sp. LH3U1]